MTESYTYWLITVFFLGIIMGILLMLLIIKIKGGSVVSGAAKREFDAYQDKVESHFDEASKKFQAMAEQYKDLYQHLSVGATTLCRPEHSISGLSDNVDPLRESATLDTPSGVSLETDEASTIK